MLATTKDLISEFMPSTAYTCSDEITLVFPSSQFGIVSAGRISKIVSLSASLCAARFNHHLSTSEGEFPPAVHFQLENLNLKKKAAMTNFRWYFDSRAFNLPNEEEALVISPDFH
jgi:tRNA(His) 5'-end guanylyltransferase